MAAAQTGAQAVEVLQEPLEIKEEEEEQAVELPLLKRPRWEPDVSPTAAELVNPANSSADDAAGLAAAVDETVAGAQVMVVLMGIPGSGAFAQREACSVDFFA